MALATNDMLEIERKFLVLSNDYRKNALKEIHIIQGFLNSNKERTVRVRKIDKEGFLTVKGIASKDGTTRFEWEKKITGEEAIALLQLCEPELIEKIRYEVKINNHTFEVDEFLGKNTGLVIAEVELQYADETFQKPEWLGKEVTGQIKYYNSNLSKQPFNTW